MNAQPKPHKIVQDNPRLEFVREMPCLVVSHGKCINAEHLANFKAHALTCTWNMATSDCEAHHVRKGTQTGLSRKPPANRTVPLCSAAHTEFHAIGHAAFEEKYGLDLEAHLVRINREFEASRPKLVTKRTKPTVILLTVRQCIGCGLTHALMPSKWQRGTTEIRYFCGRRNAYFVWEMTP